MIKLLPLIFENEVDHEEDIGKIHIISERGYEFIKSKIDEMNKKASKWGVPPMDLKIIKEEFIKRKILVNKLTGLLSKLTSWEDPESELREIIVKQYEIQILGDPPSVDGYEFIAKIEHTPDGNILNYAPKASSKNIPTEYRTARQACDVCKTTRDRNNTFILKLEKDDHQRFPEKRSGDFIMVGSGCLKRFLPNISTNALIEYAEIIESIRENIQKANEMDDFDGDLGSSGHGDWLSQDIMGLWLSAVYLHTGKFISKKKAQEFQTSSTIDNVFSAMHSKIGEDIEDTVHKRMREDEPFKDKAKSLNQEFLEWIKTKDFDSLINANSDFSDFYHNLKILSKQENFKSKNSGFFSALFATFLRDKGDFERKFAQKKNTVDFTYFGQIGNKIKVRVRVNKIKEYESQYGRGLIITMEANGVDKDEHGQDVSKKGNLLYFTSKFELKEGDEAEIEATVKNHQVNKYTQIPETQITRAKVLDFITHPEKNAGKSKVKDLKGVVRISNVYEQMDWGSNKKTYNMAFNYDITHHPDMTQTGSPWGIQFHYQIPNESTYQSLKQYEGKIVDATWSLTKSISVDKLKSNSQNDANKIQILKILGDAPTK